VLKGFILKLPTVHQPPTPGWRRLAALAVDYGIILAYLAVLGLVGVLGRSAGVLPRHISTPGGRIVAQLAVIAVLTVPVTLWFAWWEAAPRGATLGKRLLGLRVSRLDGGGLSWPRSLLRSTVRIAVPWELAHTGVWNTLVWPGPDAPVNLVLFTVANGVLLANLVMLFVGERRPLYDRVAGTVVRVVPSARHRTDDRGRSRAVGA
jgi:uncharacterized RDD family membrane protein YckC